jgi:hypothetical protein
MRIKPIFFRICRKINFFSSDRKKIKFAKMKIKSVFENNFKIFNTLILKKL